MSLPHWAASRAGPFLRAPSSSRSIGVRSRRRFTSASRVSSRERTQFHAPYRVRVTQPPVDWIDVITPFHRVELAAETNARSGGRIFGQREAIEALREAAEPDRPALRDELPPAQHVRRECRRTRCRLCCRAERRVTPRAHRSISPIRTACGVGRARVAQPERQPCVRQGAACRRRNDGRGARRIDARSEPTGRLSSCWTERLSWREPRWTWGRCDRADPWKRIRSTSQCTLTRGP